MVLAGVIEEFVRHAALLVGELLGELRPQAQGLANWHGVILVAVDDQHGRADIPHEAVRRMVLQHLRADFLPPVVVGVGGRTELAQVQRLAWLTMARKRSVCPAIQLAM